MDVFEDSLSVRLCFQKKKTNGKTKETIKTNSLKGSGSGCSKDE